MSPRLNLALRFFLFLLLIIGVIFLILLFNPRGRLPGEKKVFIEGQVGQPLYLNPLFADWNAIDRELTPLIYRGLIHFNENQVAVGDLAESWKIKEEGKVYEITLRNNQFWHDGKKITSEDVVFTYGLTQNKEYQGPEKNTFAQVKIEAIGPFEVRFTLSEPFAPFLENLTLGILPAHLWQDIPPQELIRSPLNLQPVGSGILKFHRLKFNPEKKDWVDWLEFEILNGKIDYLRLRFYARPPELVTAYKLGEIQAFILDDPQQAAGLKNWPNLIPLHLPLQGKRWVLFFNLGQKKFASRLLRRYLAQQIYATLPYKERFYSPLSPHSWAYEKQTLNKVNRDDLNLPSTIEITLPYDHRYQIWGEKIKKIWEKEGIKVKLNLLNAFEFQKVIRQRDFEVLLLEQEISRDPDQYILWHSTQAESPRLNLAGLKHPKIDKALEKGRQSISIDERKKSYQELQKYFVRESAVVFLGPGQLHYYLSSKIKNVDLPRLWNSGERFLSLPRWSF